jgi:hypothetical protein
VIWNTVEEILEKSRNIRSGGMSGDLVYDGRKIKIMNYHVFTKREKNALSF